MKLTDPYTLATSCEELTHWKRLWCWEGLGAGGEGDDRGWDGWMASPTPWTWVWVNSRSWWWTGRPGVLRFMGSWRVGHDWATEVNYPKYGRWFMVVPRETQVIVTEFVKRGEWSEMLWIRNESLEVCCKLGHCVLLVVKFLEWFISLQLSLNFFHSYNESIGLCNILNLSILIFLCEFEV